jgi:soluble lytic murein transglycosylase-like protein
MRLALLILLAVPVGGARAQPSPTEVRTALRANSRYDATFRRYSKRYFGAGFDWSLFKAQAMAESELNPDARSWVGARGLMQLMPSTFQEIQTKRPEFTSIDDPEWNIAAGIMHDRYLWRLWEPIAGEGDRAWFMFGSYNAGEGTISRAAAAARALQLDATQWPNIEQVAPSVPRWRYRETIGYVRKIDGNVARLRGSKPRG